MTDDGRAECICGAKAHPDALNPIRLGGWIDEEVLVCDQCLGSVAAMLFVDAEPVIEPDLPALHPG